MYEVAINYTILVCLENHPCNEKNPTRAQNWEGLTCRLIPLLFLNHSNT